MSGAALYFGEVMHRRFGPAPHRFVYRVFTALFDLDRLAAVASASRLFAYNRPGLVSFHDRDHGPRDGSPLRPWLEAQLRAAGLPTPARIELVCFPRLFGYVFNPLSVYFCYRQDATLFAVVHEVKNTFGGQHAYVLPADGGATLVRQQAEKVFYVSPFIGMAATYRFRLRRPGERLFIGIAESVPEGRKLVATQTGRRVPFTDANLVRALLQYPLMTLKIIVGIHWEALRLWRKGARYHPPPRPATLPKHPVSEAH